ncbi:hypothetical protein COU00_02465 [Candidatus Falkowbacteria bacterium CG10_big_fil_rev_8_21_14_0_10_43_11]|uniref:Uncharacterized protein n=1 Tax=Candidatus Falkowbacteria bacterium CG10_big_fil_rev_8_21_14_0_10_43_11 TaxID=1974568 RepID=A0A2M6WLY2_9BACT|nr:MAG: hypothetical protein COU00_02465 [Candidatus Falkowbacteria bacterium CG10_big_fil_rev_8_21_14_0_10_43_11]
MTATVWLRTIRASVLWFAILSLLAFSLAAVAFSYAFNKYLQEGKVLGITAQNQPSDLSLFSGQVRLVKSANNPGVYALIGKFKYLIRNEEVFYSYDYNFRDVKIVSERELNKYQLVRLVKERGTGKVYFLAYAQNVKKYHPSPAAFSSYPANRWSDVVEVSSKDLSFWDDANLLKAADNPVVYYIYAGKKAPIPSANEFINAGFDWNKILTASRADLNTYGNIDFNVNLTKKNTDGSTTTAVNFEKQLIVTLDQTSPSASIFPYATAGNIVAVYKLQALSGNININSLTFTKSGLLSIDKITTVTIEDENGLEFDSTASISTSISNNIIKIKFDKNPLVIPRSVSKLLRVKVSFATGSEVNHTIGLSLQSEKDIVSDAVITGIFPLNGATHKLILAEGIIGQIKILSQEINSTARNVNLGTKKETIAKFNISETTGNEKASISAIAFTNYGTAESGDIDNISLYQDNKLIATARDLQNHKAIFDLSKNNITVANNKPVELMLKADILKGENTTLKFVFDSPNDIKVKGLTQGFNLTVSGVSENFPIGLGGSDAYNKVVFKRIGIGLIASKIEEKDTKIFRGQADTIFGKFELRNAGENIFLQRVKLRVEKFNGAPDIADDIYVMETKTKEKIVIIGKEKVAGGVIADISLGNYKVAANATITFWVVAKVPENSQTGNNYQVNIPELSYKIGLDNTEYVQTTATAGQLMRVYAPRLALTAGVLSNEGIAVAGNKGIELGSFKLQASVDEKIKITGIVVSLATSSSDVTYPGGFSELALYSGSRVSPIISQPNSRTYTFSNLSVAVAANASFNLTVKADTAIIAAGKTVQFKLESITAEGYSSRAPVDVSGEGMVSPAVKINPAAGS